jgi:hypothetical protein
MADTISFPDHQGVPFQPDPPFPDGFAEPEPWMDPAFGSAPSRVDTGWAGAGRETYGGATAVGVSSPLMSLTGVKERGQDFLHLSFVVRRDPSFDQDDRVIVVLHPDFAAGSVAKTGDERRIDIEPITAAGAGPGVQGALTIDPDPWGVTVGHEGYKTDRLPRNVEYYRWDTGSNSWAPTDNPANLTIRVRSWNCGQNNRNYAVEMRVPTSRAAGGGQWMDMTAEIGFYCDVVRVTQGAAVGVDFATQFSWPIGQELHDNGGLLDLDEIEIEPAKLGRAVLGQPTGPVRARGVRIGDAYGAVGVRPAGSNAAPGHEIVQGVNEFIATVLNDDVTEPAPGVTAEFRIANWGIGPNKIGLWNKFVPVGGAHNPSDPADLPAAVADPNAPDGVAASTAQLTTMWQPGPEFGTTLWKHQCIWVRLESTQGVSFVRSSKVQNMDVATMSEFEQDAEVNGSGWPDDDGSDLEFLLLTSSIALSFQPRRRRGGEGVRTAGDGVGPGEALLRMLPPQRRGTAAGEEREGELQQVFVTVVDGYRRTPRTLTVRGKQYPIYSYADSYGHTGVHATSVPEDLVVELSGPAVEGAGGGGYLVRVPRDGVTTVTTRLRTGQVEDRQDDAAYWLEQLLQLLIRLLQWVLQQVRRWRSGR